MASTQCKANAVEAADEIEGDLYAHIWMRRISIEDDIANCISGMKQRIDGITASESV